MLHSAEVSLKKSDVQNSFVLALDASKCLTSTSLIDLKKIKMEDVGKCSVETMVHVKILDKYLPDEVLGQKLQL